MSTTAPYNDSVEKRRAACNRLRERIRNVGSTRVEHLLAEDPSLASDDDAILELILAEMMTRREMGDAPQAEEWEERIRGMLPDPRRRESIQGLLSTEMKTLAGTPSAPSVAVAPRARIGRYHVLEEIGRGGMGVVYKARQLTPGRIVAIKMILAGDHANARERARLRTEAEAAAKLAHPNIVQILDADFHEGLPFLVMEFVDGGNLAQMIRALPQPIRWSARLIETLARAIHVAHDCGIIHRDLNPTNILMTQAGVPKIGDFGLAKFLLTDSTTSQGGKILGTPSYMAPEQLADGGLEVDARTDVYALGAILYEMLTGMPPFRGLTPMETLCQVAEGEVVPPSRLRHGLPEDLETICLKCLDRNPAARYADAEALAGDLRRFQNREPILARRTPRLRRLLQWAGREPLAASLLGLSFLLLLTLLIVSALYSLMLQSSLEERVRQSTAAQEREYAQRITRKVAEAESELAQRSQYDLRLGRIYEYAARKEAELAIEEFDALRRRAPEKLGFESRYLDRLIHRSARLLSDEGAHKSPVTRIAVTRDGRTLISGDVNGKIVEWDVATRRPTAELARDNGRPVRGLAAAERRGGRPSTYAAVHVDEDSDAGVVAVWAEGARQGPTTFREVIHEVAEVGFGAGATRLAVRCRGPEGPAWRTLFFSAKNDEWVEATDETLSDTTCAASSAGGDVLAVGCADGSILVRGPGSEQGQILIPPDPARPTCIALSADGGSLAAGWDDGRIVTWDLNSGALTSILSCDDGSPTYLAFCWEGRGVVALEGDRTLTLHDLEPGRERRLLPSTGVSPMRLAVSPAGDALAAGFESEAVRLWDLTSPSLLSREVSRLRAPICLQFSPDGGSLFLNFDQPSIFIWATTTEPHPRMTLAGHSAEAWALAFSPDGRLLASGGDDHQIKLWDATDGTELWALEAHSQTVSGLAFSPDGEHLASVSLDGSWKIWRVVQPGDDGGGRLEKLKILRPRDRSQLRCVAYSADGSMIAASGLTPEILINSCPAYDSSAVIPSAHSAMITSLAFSPAPPTILASASCDRRLRLWDPSTGWCESDKQVDGALMALAFSRLDHAPYSQLAAAGDQRYITFLDGGNRNVGKAIREHPASVRSLSFSKDAATLASGCDDGLVRLSDVETRQVVLTLEGHNARVNAVAFSPDNMTLATCSHTGEVFLWKAAPPAP